MAACCNYNRCCVKWIRPNVARQRRLAQQFTVGAPGWRPLLYEHAICGRNAEVYLRRSGLNDGGNNDDADCFISRSER